MRRLYPIFCSFLCFLVVTSALGQKSKSQLEAEKRENLKKIKETERILAETKTEKSATIGQLNAINIQIEAREGLINAISEEIGLLDSEIQEINLVMNAMERDLKDLKKEYAAMVYAASKANSGMSQIVFLFSAESFNQLLRRLQYMKQYAEVRENQVYLIEKVRASLDQQRQSVQGKRIEKKSLLAQQIEENKNLLQIKNKQKHVIYALSKREKELKGELADRKVAVDKLDKLIADLVRKEIEAARAAELANRVNTEAVELSSLFEKSRAKMLWPVSSGFVSSKFGRHPHPIFKGVVTENMGIDIQTKKDEKVRSVFDGKVTAIAAVPGMHNVVIVQHGQYHTVYAKLKNVYVQSGQYVKAKDLIGEVYTDKDGVSELQFQVWKDNEKINPQSWLTSR